MYGTVQPASKLNFTRYCDVASPLSWNNTLLSMFVYSFEDCIEACAGINFYKNNGDCQLAAFKVNGGRPLNCWLGSYNTTYADLKAENGTGIALLRSS